jgi:hypothetical protein
MLRELKIAWATLALIGIGLAVDARAGIEAFNQWPIAAQDPGLIWNPAAFVWLVCGVLALLVMVLALLVANRRSRVARTLADTHCFIEGLRDTTGRITYDDGRPPTAGPPGPAGPVLVRVAGDTPGDYRSEPATLVTAVVPGTRYDAYERLVRQTKGDVRAALLIVVCLAAAGSLYACSTMQTSIFMH